MGTVVTAAKESGTLNTNDATYTHMRFESSASEWYKHSQYYHSRVLDDWGSGVRVPCQMLWPLL